MHDDVDGVEIETEEQRGFDHLEALVDQGRAVDGDHGTHVPGGMCQRVLRRDIPELRAGTAAERAAARRQHQPTYLLGAAATQALRQRRVLRVDGHDLARSSPIGDQGSADDERFLVGQGQRAAGVEGGQRGFEADRAGHRVEDDITGPRGDLGRRVGSGEDLREDVVPGAPSLTLGLGVEGQLQVRGRTRLRDGDHLDAELQRLRGEQLDTRSAAGEADHAEALRVAPNNVQRLRADRAGGAEQHEVAAAGHRPIVARPRIRGRVDRREPRHVRDRAQAPRRSTRPPATRS